MYDFRLEPGLWEKKVKDIIEQLVKCKYGVWIIVLDQ